MSSINRSNDTQGSAAESLNTSLWQKFKQWLDDKPSTPNPQAESLNQPDHYQASKLGQSVVNLSRQDHSQGNALELQQTLDLSEPTLLKETSIDPPQNWRSLYLDENRPVKWSHQIQPIASSIQQLADDKRLSQKLADSIEQLKTEPLHPQLEPQRTALIQAILQDIAAPEKIMQGNKDTCVATTAQIKLAIEDPVKYVAIMLAIAGPSGQSELTLAPQNQADEHLRLDARAIPADASGRNLSNRLFQAALMEYANGKHQYDPEKDMHTYQNTPGNSGLKDFENQALMQALFVGKYQNLSIQQGQTQSSLAQRIENAVSAGVPISTGMRWGDGGHQVLVVKMNQDQVQIINPQSMGALYYLPRGDFEKHLLSAVLPTEADPSLKQNPDKPGHIADQSRYQALPLAAYLNAYEFLDQLTLPLDLKNSLGNAWSKTGLQSRHFSGLQSVLDKQPQELKRAYQDTLADLSTASDLNPIQGGQGILKLNQFVDLLWQKKGTVGLKQVDHYLQNLRQSGLQTIWSQPEKAQQILDAARAGQLTPALIQHLKD